MESRVFKISPTTTIHTQITLPAVNEDNKPLLVFLHYWGGSSATWHRLTAPESPTSLSTHYPTMAVDLRGWGKSTGPLQDEGAAYSTTTMASDIVQILLDLDTNKGPESLLRYGFVLVGHSMGAKVALAALAGLPSSMLNFVKGLALIAPSPPTALQLPPHMKDQQKIAYDSEESVRWTLQNVLSDITKLDDTDISSIVRDSLSGNSCAKKAWPTYGMEEDISSAVQVALKALVSSCVEFRVVVMAGELDIVEPKSKVESGTVQFLVDTGIQPFFDIIGGAKHLIPLEAAIAVKGAMSKF